MSRVAFSPNPFFLTCLFLLHAIIFAFLQEIESHKPYPQPDLYHRYDFVKYLDVGSIIVDKPIAFLSNTSFPATLSRSK